jgi:signal transduction histidine kinase
VEVSLRESGGGILLEVRNQGPPIAPDLLPRIFEPFQRGDGGDGGDERLGLGLYIVKHVVEAHGGTIKVRSSELNGTTFSIQWPGR